MAKIVLLRPPTAVSRWAHTTPTCPPIGLAYVSSSLKAAGHESILIDAVGESVFQMTPIESNDTMLSHGLTPDEIYDRIPEDVDHIGVSCMFSHEWPEARRLIKGLRKRFPNATIIGGGEHFAAMPEDSLFDSPELDYCVLGEGEETLVDLIDAIQSKRSPAEVEGIAYRVGESAKQTPARKRIRNLDDIPEPDWEQVPMDNYLDNGFGFGVNRGRSMPILATRGCPYQCTFCSNPTMWTTRWFARDAKAVLDEMKFYKKRYNVDNFDFYDLTAIVRKDWIVRFANMLIEEDMDITWQLPSGTRSEALDEETAELMYRSGCRNLSFAPESGSPGVLERIKKKILLPRMRKSMGDCIRNGMNIKANIILGFPGETHKEVRETMGFIAQMAFVGVHDVSISPFSPYPGSELFEDLRRDNRIPKLDDDYYWSLASYTDITQSISYSEHISDKALSRYRILGMAMFYALSYIARPLRVFRTIRNLYKQEHESRLEMSLHDLAVRLAKKS